MYFPLHVLTFFLMQNFKLVLTLLASVAVASGCSTISGSGTSQPISVQTFASDGSDVDGAKCDMTNDEGTWFVVTPGSTTVRRSNKDLQVICRKPDIDIGNANVVSRTKGNMWGNILLGGGVGAIIDHNNGSAYEYPSLIKIFMGRQNQRIEAVASQTGQGEGAANTQPVSNGNSEVQTVNKPAQ